jgi:hypothetical protein
MTRATSAGRPRPMLKGKIGHQPSQIKQHHHRATKAEVEARRGALLGIIEAGKPMTVRQVFYQAIVHGVVEKAESGSAKVQTDLTLLRRMGVLPYEYIADNTRWQRKPRTSDSVEDALRETAAFYRKALWSNADCYVEIWLEKDALAGVIYPITSLYDVPLMVARGWGLPTRPTKANDTRSWRIAVTPRQINAAKNLGDVSVELDAIEPNRLRRICRTRSPVAQPPTPMHARAVACYEDEFRRALAGEIISAIAKASILDDAPLMATRTSETLHAEGVASIFGAQRGGHA